MYSKSEKEFCKWEDRWVSLCWKYKTIQNSLNNKGTEDLATTKELWKM